MNASFIETTEPYTTKSDSSTILNESSPTAANRNHRPIHIRRSGGSISISALLLPRLLVPLLVLLLPVCLGSTFDYLDENSVVLITGAAGFLGSELAMALHRTYHVKKIICVDSLESISGEIKTEEDLALFEFKRQRAFHLMQTLGKHAVFYRADFRPSIPEYFDVGEVPILDFLVRDHSDITHLVHLAQDKYANDQAVPRKKEDISSGMIEALFEQILKFQKTPHFTYASSYEVYNHLHPSDTNPVPFSEEKPITTPSSLRGASKVIDELLARTYHQTHKIFSVGLRFFSVYGPWGVPGSPLFEMAERAVMESPLNGKEESQLMDDVRDYVYIDDAIDALMAAMQYRTPDGAPVVINIASGEGTSLRQVAHQMQDFFPPSQKSVAVNNDFFEPSAGTTVSYANINRAKLLLGFQPRISLREGLVRLLSWHYDRAFPYGGRPVSSSSEEANVTKRNYIASQGIASCSPFDKECLRGATVFPCSSECSHEAKCTSSFYDDVLIFTRSLTSKCATVMYTVDMNKELSAIPSANMAISTHHSSHLQDECNIAFVSESSNLVKRLKQEQGFSTVFTAVETFLKYATKSKGKTTKVLKHGFWTLVPVSTPTFSTGDEHILHLLPKLSPGIFFGEATTHAIYCDPDVVFKDIPTLLQEAKMQPYRAGTQGVTTMLVARERPTKHASSSGEACTITVSEAIQNAAYRMVRIGVIDEMSGDGYHPLLDSSWVVHALKNEDSRLFRCDVFGEVVQWDVGTDETAFEFITGLHDMWSRVIVKESGDDPWWLGDGVITVPQNYANALLVVSPIIRRLQQVEQDEANDEKGNGYENGGAGNGNTGNVLEAVEKDAGDAAGFNGNKEPDAPDQDADDAVEMEAAAEGAGGDAGAKDNKEPDTSEQDEDGAVEKDEAVQGDVVVVDTADDDEASSGQEDTEDDVEDVGADEANEIDSEQVLNMNQKADDDEADTDDDATIGDEKEEAFANDNPAEKAGIDAKRDVAKEKENGGFWNAGDAKVEVGKRPEGEIAEQDLDEEENSNVDNDSENDEFEEENQGVQAQVKAKPVEAFPDRDPSSYDTWMGVLSSTSVHYFVRIVPSSEVGATYLDDYKY
jgi:UDP-glucuronate 4-epimerase